MYLQKQDELEFKIKFGLRTPNFKAFEGTRKISPNFLFVYIMTPGRAQAHTRFYNSYKIIKSLRESRAKDAHFHRVIKRLI